MCREEGKVEGGEGGGSVVQDRIPTLAAYKALTPVSCYWSTNLQVMLCTDWRLSSYHLDTPKGTPPHLPSTGVVQNMSAWSLAGMNWRWTSMLADHKSTRTYIFLPIMQLYVYIDIYIWCKHVSAYLIYACIVESEEKKCVHIWYTQSYHVAT